MRGGLRTRGDVYHPENICPRLLALPHPSLRSAAARNHVRRRFVLFPSLRIGRTPAPARLKRCRRGGKREEKREPFFGIPSIVVFTRV